MKKAKSMKDINTISDMLNYILGILENRREQIAERSTVSLAASSGLFVLIIGFITDALKKEDGSQKAVVIFLLISLILTSISIITTLDLIKKISRKKNQKRLPRENPLYFGWLASKTEEEIFNKFSSMDKLDYIRTQIRQSASLSKNLKYRYSQLKKTYSFFIAGLVFYIISFILNILYKYGYIDQIAKWIGMS